MSISDRLNALENTAAKHDTALTALLATHQKSEFEVATLQQIVQVLANENRFLKQQLHALIVHLIMAQTSAPEPQPPASSSLFSPKSPIGTGIPDTRPAAVGAQQKTFLKGLLESIVQSNSQPSAHSLVSTMAASQQVQAQQQQQQQQATSSSPPPIMMDSPFGGLPRPPVMSTDPHVL
jgi:hypothetical protein